MAAVKDEERKAHKIDHKKVNKGDLMALTYWVKVKDVQMNNTRLIVDDLDNGTANITVSGKELIDSSFSADQYEEEVTVGKTKAAEMLISSPNRPLTVAFEKQDGTQRVLRGRLVKHEALLGRSMVEDLDLPGPSEKRIRQVDHRTIQFLVVDGVKYNVK